MDKVQKNKIVILSFVPSAEIVLFSEMSIPAVGPTQHLLQWVSGVFPGTKHCTLYSEKYIGEGGGDPNLYYNKEKTRIIEYFYPVRRKPKARF